MTWFPGSQFAPLEDALRFFPGLVPQGFQQSPAVHIADVLQQYKWPVAAIFLFLLVLQAALIGILLYEQRRRKRANDALDAAARVFDTTGDSFFRSLTEHLNSLLRADYVSISELSADGLRLKTVAVTADGKNLDNLEYLLDGTPCKKVLEQGRFFDRNDVQAHFPQDSFLAELGFQSYLGVALLDSAKRPLGVMSVLSRQRAKEASVVEATLEMFAARASAEMERRRSRQALEASEARNRAILRGIPDVMFVLDAEGTVLDYSASEQNELYTPPDQILHRHIREKLPVDAAEAMTRAASQATGASEPASVEFSLPMQGGLRFYDARIVPMEAGKVLAIVRSITLQKQAELDLQKNSRLFSQILKMLPGALFVYDLAERRNVYVNQGGWGLLGYTDREVLEMGNGFVQHTLHPDDFATLPKLAEQYAGMADGEVVAHLFRMKHKNGSWRWVQRHAAVFSRTTDGRPQQLIGTASDVTALKTAEEDLRQLSTRLLNAQDQERRRIARQLHDGTAQNIFAVRLNLARLAQQGDLSESATKILSECQSLCDTSLQEIRTLVYLMHPPMLDQGGLVPAMRWFVDGFSSRSSLSVELVVSPAMERLPSGMERDLFLIVQEALSNVVRHSGSKRAVVRLEREAQEVTLQIIDFGRGMPPGTADPDAKNTMGVGIPSMRERLRQNGGRLEVQSSSQGTTVIARVPLPASHVAAEAVT